jgi:hypothetical protein
MPTAIDWNAFDQEIGAAIDRAANRTDAQLASRVSSITRLTDAEIQSLFPTPADVKRLGDLLKIVNAATDKNTKINDLITNIESLAGTVITLVGKFA